MQSKLLRVLQEREVRRVGENKTRAIDVRVIAATHRDLAAEVKAGPLPRRSLLPAAGDRAAGARRCASAPKTSSPSPARPWPGPPRAEKLPLKELSPEASRRVLAHPWPGNVRELLNAMERALVLAPGQAHRGQRSAARREAARAARAATSEHRTLAEVEREVILSTLAAERGSRARTAERLAIGQATLFRKLKQYQSEGHLVAPAA